MNNQLPKTIMSGGFVYHLEFTDFPDEDNYNVSYTSDGKWPDKKVLLQYSESSRERCVKKAWKRLFELGYKVYELKEQSNG